MSPNKVVSGDLFPIRTRERAMLFGFLSLLALLWVLPLSSLLTNALKVGGPSNFVTVVTQPVNGVPYFQYFVNSVVVALGSSLTTVIIGVLSGFAFSKLRFRGRIVIYQVVISCLTISAVIIAVPLYYILKGLGLYNTHAGVVLIEAAQTLPFAVLMFKTYFDQVPSELLESASVDGAKPYQLFFRIFLPLSRPVLINLGVLQVMWSFQDFYVPLMYLTKQSLFTAAISVNVYKGLYGTIGANTGLYNAALTLVGVPAIILFAVAQKYIVRGLTAGAVKG